MRYALQVKAVRLDEALIAYKLLTKGLTDEVSVLASLLPCLADPQDVSALVRLKLGNEMSRVFRLKTLVGQAFLPLTGHYNGYYHLNLLNENDRLCLRLLIQKSESVRRQRQSQALGDVSQTSGQWSCFRNVMHRREAPDEEDEDADEFGLQYKHEIRDSTEGSIREVIKLGHIPRKGLYEFDFVALDNSQVGVGVEISNMAFSDSLLKAGLMSQNKIRDVLTMVNQNSDVSPNGE
jgi:hypothetical protein